MSSVIWYWVICLTAHCFDITKVAHCQVTLSTLEYIIAHGPSKFVKPDKIANLQRQERDRTPGKFTGEMGGKHFALLARTNMIQYGRT